MLYHLGSHSFLLYENNTINTRITSGMLKFSFYTTLIMKLILLEGGPASGKNTLGTLLIEEFHKLGDKSILLDRDCYVEELNPKWVWKNERQKKKDLINASIAFAKDVNKHLQDNFVVVAIGERFLSKGDYTHFISRLKITCPIYLYHLSVPLNLRKQRLHKRGPNSIIDLEKDQKVREEVKHWIGYVYENTNVPKVDASNLMKLIQSEKGLMNSLHCSM
jgi:thymidylate kinase